MHTKLNKIILWDCSRCSYILYRSESSKHIQTNLSLKLSTMKVSFAIEKHQNLAKRCFFSRHYLEEKVPTITMNFFIGVSKKKLPTNRVTSFLRKTLWFLRMDPLFGNRFSGPTFLQRAKFCKTIHGNRTLTLNFPNKIVKFPFSLTKFFRSQSIFRDKKPPCDVFRYCATEIFWQKLTSPSHAPQIFENAKS